MAILRSTVEAASDAYRANADAMQALVEDLRRRTDAVAGRGAAGDDRAIARHRERGKLPVRERMERLIDPGSAFLRCAKPALTSARSSGSGGGATRRRPTSTESTFGTGWKTRREIGRRTRTSHASWASTDGAP